VEASRAVAINERVRRERASGPMEVQDLVVKPEAVFAMRLAGKARLWEDAHSWEAVATACDLATRSRRSTATRR
jgi:hypothetical protein